MGQRLQFTCHAPDPSPGRGSRARRPPARLPSCPGRRQCPATAHPCGRCSSSTIRRRRQARSAPGWRPGGSRSFPWSSPRRWSGPTRGRLRRPGSLRPDRAAGLDLVGVRHRHHRQLDRRRAGLPGRGPPEGGAGARHLLRWPGAVGRARRPGPARSPARGRLAGAGLRPAGRAVARPVDAVALRPLHRATAGATELARSEAGSQAFVSGRSLGLQFHPEVDEAIVTSWLDGAPAEELAGPEVDVPAIRADSARLAPVARAACDRLVDWFLDDVAGLDIAGVEGCRCRGGGRVMAAGRKPLIGLTGRRKAASAVDGMADNLGQLPVDLYLADYATCVLAAGGLPVHLPMDADPADYLPWLHGVLLSGGADVEPGRYGQQPDGNGHYETDRDDLELALLDLSLQRELPVLGICRGLQLINIHAGGTLHQDVPPHARYDLAARPAGPRRPLRARDPPRPAVPRPVGRRGGRATPGQLAPPPDRRPPRRGPEGLGSRRRGHHRGAGVAGPGRAGRAVAPRVPARAGARVRLADRPGRQAGGERGRAVTVPPGDANADLTSHDTYTAGVPHATFARLRREEPVSWVDEADGSGFWAVTRYRDIIEVSRNVETFTSRRGIRLEEMSARGDRGPAHPDGARPTVAHPPPPAGEPGLHPPHRGGLRGPDPPARRRGGRRGGGQGAGSTSSPRWPPSSR